MLSEIEKLKKELADVKAKLKVKEQEVIHANETIDLLSVTPVSKSGSNLSILGNSEELLELQQECEILKNERSKYQSECHKLREENKKLNSANSSKGSTNSKELIKLQKKCDILTAECSKYQSECSKLRTENKQLILAIPVSSNEYDAVRNKKIQVLHDELDRVNALCESISSERAKFQSMNYTLEAENKRLTELSSKKPTSDSHATKVIVDSNTSLQKMIRELESEKTERTLTSIRLEEENNSLQSQNEELQNENSVLQSKNVALHFENESLQSENVELHSRVTELSISAGSVETVGNSGSWTHEKEETLNNLNFLVSQIRKNSQ